MDKAIAAGAEAVLQHDNAPSHTTEDVADTRRKWQRLIKWPPMSPDLSVIELVWHLMDEELLRLGGIYDADTLRRLLPHLWQECTTPAKLRPLFTHVWEHMQRVVLAGGSNAMRD
jgi:hypothetical protein